jgi:hypothetical protein
MKAKGCIVHWSTLVPRKNHSVENVICTYCEQVGHEFKHYLFFYDKLKQLLKDEVMNIINLLLQMPQLNYLMHLSKELK